MVAKSRRADNRIRRRRAPWNDLRHMGPGTLAGRWLRMYWHPIAIAREYRVARPKPVRVLGEDLTLYRGESGEFHLLDFLCAHRLTQLSTGWVRGENLQCFYHGWVYDQHGQCIEQPLEPKPFCEKIKIRSFPVQEYLGLVFAFLGEGEPPPLPRYPHLARLETRAEGYVRNCNVFQHAWENDSAHVPFTHLHGRDLSLVDGDWTETAYGIALVPNNGGQPVQHRGMPLPNVTGAYDNSQSQAVRQALARIPGIAPGVTVRWYVPRDDESHYTFDVGNNVRPGLWEHSEEAAEISRKLLSGEIHFDDIKDQLTATVRTNVEDTITQVGQGVIFDDEENERRGYWDAQVVLARRIWRRELKALAEGQPLKQWKYEPLDVEERPLTAIETS